MAGLNWTYRTTSSDRGQTGTSWPTGIGADGKNSRSPDLRPLLRPEQHGPLRIDDRLACDRQPRTHVGIDEAEFGTITGAPRSYRFAARYPNQWDHPNCQNISF
jgi:hypothetical protein